MMLNDILWIALIVAVGLLMFFLGTYLGKPPIVGKLTVDVTDWDVNKYNIDISEKVPLVDLPDYKIVGLRVESFRDKDKGSSETD